MAKNDPTTAQISELLDERKKLEQWLTKLERAADKKKSGVADKVRQDYQQRLDEVTGELGQFGDGLREQRDTHAKALDKLREQEAERSEEMAEAELRHEVGEYDSSTWARKKSSINEKLASIQKDIAEAEKNLASVEDVLAALTAEPEDEEEVEPEPEPEPPEEDEEEEEPVKPRSKGKKKDQPELGDELAFLKSVTEDERGGPSPKRASGAVARPPMAEDEKKSIEKSRPSVVNQRTLKCKECGSMNLPTEWYCEKCGAELASL